MEPTTRPTGSELADEIGISDSTFSMVRSGKRKLSKKTQARWDAVMNRYERADEQHDLEQRETVARSELSQKLLAIVAGTDDE